jgi:hypothetical protein
MISVGLGTKNDYAGESQQQYTRKITENKKSSSNGGIDFFCTDNIFNINIYLLVVSNEN